MELNCSGELIHLMFNNYNNNPFNSRKANVTDFNTLIIEKYLQHCASKNSDELSKSDLVSFLRDTLDIPSKLLLNVKDISGQLVYQHTSIIDPEQLFWYANLLLILKRNLTYIDEAWKLLTNFVSSDRVSLGELVEVQKEINDTNTYQTLKDMMSLATNGERLSMNFVDFAMLLGKLEEIE